jgi:hypothetical protein
VDRVVATNKQLQVFGRIPVGNLGGTDMEQSETEGPRKGLLTSEHSETKGDGLGLCSPDMHGGNTTRHGVPIPGHEKLVPFSFVIELQPRTPIKERADP